MPVAQVLALPHTWAPAEGLHGIRRGPQVGAMRTQTAEEQAQQALSRAAPVPQGLGCRQARPVDSSTKNLSIQNEIRPPSVRGWAVASKPHVLKRSEEAKLNSDGTGADRRFPLLPDMTVTQQPHNRIKEPHQSPRPNCLDGRSEYRWLDHPHPLGHLRRYGRATPPQSNALTLIR